MAIFDIVDRDKVLSLFWFYWTHPFSNWLEGIPEEPSFIHDFVRHWRRWSGSGDIGLRHEVRTSHSVALLHQRGPARTDQFGSDFAVTVEIRGMHAIKKTAVFQTKSAQDLRADVSKSQLNDMITVPQFRGRSYVLALDSKRRSMRIEASEIVLAAFASSTAQSRNLDTIDWRAASDWFMGWFECSIGRASTGIPDDSPEDLLARYISTAPDGFPGGPQRDVTPPDDVDFMPAIWQYFTVYTGDHA